MDEEIKLYSDKEKLIESELAGKKEILSKNLDRLPVYELPFMESHLRALYFETYFLLAYGFYNASLVLSGIFLENLIKEKLFMEGVKDNELEKMNFGGALNKCKEMKILSKEELQFLEIKRNNLRNPYAHNNLMKLSEGVYFPSWKVPIEKLKEVLEKSQKGELTDAQARQELIKGVKPELMSSKEFRPVAQMAKSEMEKENAPTIFIEIDKFSREFAIKYFKQI